MKSKFSVFRVLCRCAFFHDTSSFLSESFFATVDLSREKQLLIVKHFCCLKHKPTSYTILQSFVLYPTKVACVIHRHGWNYGKLSAKHEF